ncbi:MAG: phage terminase large subunit [Candidatus Diapherotrites archaeon]
MKMTVVRIKFQAHPKQQQVIDSHARFRLLAAGRRFGKSYLASAEAIRFALKEKRQTVWCVSPIYAQTRKLWRIILHLLPYKLIRNVNRSELAIELINGSVIWFKSADNPDSLRGEGIDFLILDEAALVKRESWEAALRPALSDTQGLALFISTPNSFNWFHELYVLGQLPEENEIESWQFPTSDSPFIDAEEIKKAEKSLPQIVFRQEYLAEFIDEAGSVFRGVNECISGELEGPDEKKEYVMGADLAKHQDFSVLVVMDVETKHVVAFQRFNQLSWEFQKSKIVALSKKYRNTRIVLDSSGVGDPIYDDLSRQDIDIESFKFTNESKAKLIESLSIAIEQKELTFPKISELVNELHAFGFEVLPSGRMRYCAPGHLHDDCVIALALAWKECKDYRYVDPEYPGGYPIY